MRMRNRKLAISALLGPFPPEVTGFFPVLFSPYFFFRPFFLVVVQQVGWGFSLRRPRPIAIGNYHPFYIYTLRVLYDVSVL